MAVGNVDAHVTAPAAKAVEPGQLVAIMGTSTCHVMNGAELREVPGMCGVVDGGIVDGLWGYEAGQSGVGDIFGWFTKQRRPAGIPPGRGRGGPGHPRIPHRTGRPPGHRRARPHRPGLALRQPLGAGGPRTLRRGGGPDPRHQARRHLPGAAGGHGLRHPHHRGRLPRLRRAGEGIHRGRRPAEEQAADADLRRHHRPAALHHRLNPGPGPGLGHPRRRGGRKVRGHPRSRGRHGLRTRRASTPRSRKTLPPTRNSSRSTGRSTTTSAAEPTT